MTVAAGVFVFLFGGAGAWLLAKRVPTARYTRIGYAAMGLGGLLFSIWALTHALAVGVAGAAVLAVGGVFGAIGAFRRELRIG